MADKTIEILVKGAGTAGAGTTTGTGKGGGLLSGLMGGMGAIGSLVGIAGGVTVLVSSSKALMKVLGGFFKMVMMVIKPIGDVVAVLLMPLIWMLMPLVKVMNMLFMPLRKYLMTALSAQKEEFQSLDPTRILSATMTAISHSFTAWFDTLFSGKTFEEYSPDTGFFNEFLNELGKIEIEKPKSIIENLWGILIRDVTAFFTLATVGGIQLLWDLSVAQIEFWMSLVVGKEVTVQSMFNDLAADISAWMGFKPPSKEDEDEPFDYWAGFWESLTVENFIQQWDTLWKGVDTLIGNFWKTYDELMEPIGVAWDKFWKDVETLIDNATIAVFGWSFSDSLIDLNKAITDVIDWVARQVKKARTATEEFITTVTMGLVQFPDEKPEEANDFVMTPTGGLIKTNPADYLFGTKNPAGMTGGGGTTINQTITIYAQDAEETKRKLDDLISENMRRYR